MTPVCKTEKELSTAIKNKEDEIIVEGILGKHVFRIKATGSVAWGVCVASLAVAITGIIAAAGVTVAATPAGGAAAFAVSGAALAPAAATLGAATLPAVTIGVCAGGVGALSTLRDKYKIVKKTEKSITLKRK